MQLKRLIPIIRLFIEIFVQASAITKLIMQTGHYVGEYIAFCVEYFAHSPISAIHVYYGNWKVAKISPQTDMVTPSYEHNTDYHVCHAHTITRARFLSLAWSKLRLCSANHRAGYFSNLACDWLSIVWAYSEQETENGPRRTHDNIMTWRYFPHYWPLVSWHHHANRSFCSLNTSPLVLHICQWIGWSLVMVMACHLFIAKPLPEAMLSYHQLNPEQQTSVKVKSKYKSRSCKCIWKYRLWNGCHFAQGEMGSSMTGSISPGFLEGSAGLILEMKHLMAFLAELMF